MLPDPTDVVVDNSADQLCARFAGLPPELIELVDLLSGELNLRLDQHAPPL